MKNVLVTGGAGFIGANFIHYLMQVEDDITVVNLDTLTYAGNLENLEELPATQRYHFVLGDICDRQLVEGILRHHNIDTLVHFAAETHVDRSINDPKQFIQTNVMGTFTLLEAARKVWLDEGHIQGEPLHFHHISTDEVYGSLAPSDPPFSETTPYAPNSPYAASKAASDHLVRAYWHTYNLPVTISNCSNNYGPYQYPEKLIPLALLNALAGKSLPIYGDGQQVRDWLYVEDHCEAIYMILRKGQTGETYNIGGNNQPTNLLVIQTLCEILDDYHTQAPHIPHSKLIQFVPDRPGHDRRYAMDIQKIQQQLGWQPKHNLENGLLKTIEWYLSHPSWAKSIQQRRDYQTWIKNNYQLRGDQV